VQKARTKRSRILPRDRPLAPARWAGAFDPTFEVHIRRSEGLADASYTITRTRDTYVVVREWHVPPFGEPQRESRTFMRLEVERISRGFWSATLSDYDIGYTAYVMYATIMSYLPTPYWVENVRVQFTGKPFTPRPDDDNAPDYYREGDADGATLDIAIGNALETAGCDRFGNDDY
jgi:hypothetical protein